MPGETWREGQGFLQSPAMVRISGPRSLWCRRWNTHRLDRSALPNGTGSLIYRVTRSPACRAHSDGEMQMGRQAARLDVELDLRDRKRWGWSRMNFEIARGTKEQYRDPEWFFFCFCFLFFSKKTKQQGTQPGRWTMGARENIAWKTEKKVKKKEERNCRKRKGRKKKGKK